MSSNQQEPITINGITVEPGQRSLVRLPVGRLPSGNLIQIGVNVFHSEQAGPVLLVLGGVHGDEVNGVEIVRRTLRYGLFEKLLRGTVIAIPVLNLYGFINFSRDLHDGKDVNRSFPGTRRGSLASRVAYSLTKKVLPVVDFGVDFHTGGNGVYNYPQIRYTADHPESEQLARAFGAPFLLAKKPLARSLRKAALRAGKPILVFEGGENLRLDEYSTQRALEGLRRLLYSQGMTDEPGPPASCRSLSKTTWIRAPRAGMFRWSKGAGLRVRRGEPIGRISDPQGQVEVPVYATRDGYCIGHRNAPIVSQGDALFHIACQPE